MAADGLGRRRVRLARRLRCALARPAVAALVAIAATASSGAGAAPPAPATLPAEAVAGCVACHGPAGRSQTAGTPSIAGQPALFIENQLVLIREGLREVASMSALMVGMSDETIVALARHFAAQAPAEPAARRDATAAQRGREVSQRALCGTCHLPDYSGQKQVPRLAGQDETYLRASMKHLRDQPGPGRDTIMAASLHGLTDRDLADLAHHLATYRP